MLGEAAKGEVTAVFMSKLKRNSEKQTEVHLLYSTVGKLRGLRSASFFEGLLLRGCSLKASSMFAVLIIHLYCFIYIILYFVQLN